MAVETPLHVRLIGIVIVSAALLLYSLRFATAVQTGASQDDARYLVVAESFVIGQPYRLVNYPNPPLETTFPPGYPLLILAPAWCLFGPHYDILRATSLVLGLANIGLVYRLFRPRLPQPALLLLVVLFAFNSEIAHYASLAMSDTAFLFFSLVSLIAFEQWEAKPQRSVWHSVGIVALLTMTMLVRYQGAALVTAIILYLMLKGRWRQAAEVGLGLAVSFVIVAMLLVASDVRASGSLESVQIVRASLMTLQENVPISLANYSRILPYGTLPLFGPRLSAYLAGIGLTWVVVLAHAIILSVILVGLVRTLRKRDLLGIYYAVYLIMVIGLTNRYTAEVFDETRYITALAPLTYFFLLLGTDTIVPKARAPREQLRVLYLSLSLICLLVLAGRNAADVVSQPSIPDLASGAPWVAQHVPEEAVIMTPDPVARYLYLRRKTVAFPGAGGSGQLLAELEANSVDFLLMTPPLTIDDTTNSAQVWDSYLEEVVEPTVANYPDRFALAFDDEVTRTRIYHVQRLDMVAK